MAAAAQQQAAQAPAAAPTTQATAAGFSKEQLEQIVAPMALYPDPVVSLMLMASTYPLEIVQAARWVKANPGLKDKALEEALKQHDWDASVKSMCGFPDVLKQMDENLDWTQDLGDAFLAQKTELMDTIQRMRGKAYDSGNLKTTEQQVVTQQPDKIIVVEPADPQVIYVPTYSSTVVYGGWSYPLSCRRMGGQAAGLRAALPEQRRRARRPLLARCRRRGGESARAAVCRSRELTRAGGRPAAISWLLFPHSRGPGPQRPGRRAQLPGQEGAPHARLRGDCLARQARQFRRHDFQGQPAGDRLPEGPRAGDRGGGRSDRGLRPG
jgi:hypothetical protein